MYRLSTINRVSDYPNNDAPQCWPPRWPTTITSHALIYESVVTDEGFVEEVSVGERGP